MALGVGEVLDMTRIEVRVSGVHSDTDPSPGIGIARSLREAFPDAVLQAVDYSVLRSLRKKHLARRVFPGPELIPG